MWSWSCGSCVCYRFSLGTAACWLPLAELNYQIYSPNFDRGRSFAETFLIQVWFCSSRIHHQGPKLQNDVDLCFHASHWFYRFVFPFHISLSDGVIQAFKAKQINWRLYSQFSLLHFHFCGSHQVGSNHVRHLVLDFDVSWHISVFLIYSHTNPSIQQSILPSFKTPPTVPQHSP